MAPDPGRVIPIEACRSYESLFDDRTRLPGWTLLIDRTSVALARAARRDRQAMVVVLDAIRAHPGTSFDLRASVGALRARLRSDDTIARVEDRTLVVVCNEIDADADAAGVARRLVTHVGIDCELGIALSGGHDDAISLLTQAVRDARGAHVVA